MGTVIDGGVSRDEPTLGTSPMELRGMFADELRFSTHERESAAVQGFEGSVGQLLVEQADDCITLTVGLGPRKECDTSAARKSIDSLARLNVAGRRVRIADVLDNLEQALGREGAARLLACELSLRTMSWDQNDSRDAEAFRLGTIEAEAVAAARLWTNATAAELAPDSFVDTAIRVAVSEGLEYQVRDGEQLRSDGFGLISAVGSGSAHDSFLVDLQYLPDEPVGHICLVGKGVTFDTGGLSLKRPDEMAAMRMDKAGASAVLAVMSVIRRLNPRVAVRALLPIVENMIGPSAVRPGDIVSSRSGQDVRIVDTDFEGRLILADAITFAAESDCDAIVDIATLTHQVVVALGPEIGGMFSNSSDLAKVLARAAGEAGEPVWRLPLHAGYGAQIATTSGLLKNHPETDTGRAITAALFLNRFVPTSTRWAHLDISGPAWVGPASGDGGTGFAVRTLLRLIQDLEDSEEILPRSKARTTAE